MSEKIENVKSCEDYLQDDSLILETSRKITEIVYEPSKDANNYYLITCPFCQAKTRAQVRGYYARGRRCSKCHAMFRDRVATRDKKND